MGIPRLKLQVNPKYIIFIMLIYILVIHVYFWDTEKRSNHYYLITDADSHPKPEKDSLFDPDITPRVYHILDRNGIAKLRAATRTLQKEYGSGEINLGDLSYHLNVLQTRVFPGDTRTERCNNCFPYNFKNMISPRGVCDGNDKIDMLMIITTVPKAKVARRVMRETWLTYTKNNTANTRYVFLFGGDTDKKNQDILQQEDKIFGDILQDDYKDAYYNLTQKVIMGYKWALKHCQRAKFVLRTADDNFIDVPEMVKEIYRNDLHWQKGQVGRALRNLYVTREKKYKWFISSEETPHAIYPDYAIGTAFLFSMASVKEVVEMSPNVPFFPIEDAYFGYVLRELRMKVIHARGFNVELYGKRVTDLQDGLCPLEDRSWFALHLVEPPLMAMVWEQCIHKRTVTSGLPPKYFNGWYLVRP